MLAEPFLSAKAQVSDYIKFQNHLNYLRACGQYIRCLQWKHSLCKDMPKFDHTYLLLFCFLSDCGELKESGTCTCIAQIVKHIFVNYSTNSY